EPPTSIHPLSLHDALPILKRPGRDRLAQPGYVEAPPHREAHRRALPRARLTRVRSLRAPAPERQVAREGRQGLPFARAVLGGQVDRKSTRLNSSHVKISNA